MITRTRRRIWKFNKPFRLKGIDHALPPGEYQVVTDEELIESLSFPVYRRVAMMILVPRQASRSSLEMFSIDPADLQAAHEMDAAGASGPSAQGPPSRRQ